MFSANENLHLRQVKRQIVNQIEATMPEDILDLGVNVMVMQVACQAPGCVPIETVVVIVFPKSDHELLPGLPQSQGGNYQTKILMPMAEVTHDDILDALPPQFAGGRKTLERLGIAVRDVMLAQIDQLAGSNDDDREGRIWLADYLQKSLRDYVTNGCVAPAIGEALDVSLDGLDSNTTTLNPALMKSQMSGTGNVVIRRPLNGTTLTGEKQMGARRQESEVMANPTPKASSNTSPTCTAIPPVPVDTVVRLRQQQAASRKLNGSGAVALFSHAPGIRRAGCPCCDADHPNNVIDKLMQL